jgi:hypothetical protein
MPGKGKPEMQEHGFAECGNVSARSAMPGKETA